MRSKWWKRREQRGWSPQSEPASPRLGERHARDLLGCLQDLDNDDDNDDDVDVDDNDDDFILPCLSNSFLAREQEKAGGSGCRCSHPCACNSEVHCAPQWTDACVGSDLPLRRHDVTKDAVILLPPLWMTCYLPWLVLRKGILDAEARLRMKSLAKSAIKAMSDAKIKAEAMAHAMAQAKAKKLLAKLRAEEEARKQAQAEAAAQTLAEVQALATARARALVEEKRKAAQAARAKVMAKVRGEEAARARAEEQRKARAAASVREAVAKAKAEAAAKARADAKELARLRAEAKARAKARRDTHHNAAMAAPSRPAPAAQGPRRPEGSAWVRLGEEAAPPEDTKPLLEEDDDGWEEIEAMCVPCIAISKQADGVQKVTINNKTKDEAETAGKISTDPELETETQKAIGEKAATTQEGKEGETTADNNPTQDTKQLTEMEREVWVRIGNEGKANLHKKMNIAKKPELRAVEEARRRAECVARARAEAFAKEKAQLELTKMQRSKSEAEARARAQVQAESGQAEAEAQGELEVKAEEEVETKARAEAKQQEPPPNVVAISVQSRPAGAIAEGASAAEESASKPTIALSLCDGENHWSFNIAEWRLSQGGQLQLNCALSRHDAVSCAHMLPEVPGSHDLHRSHPCISDISPR
ncbi:Protein of unknown function [Gryllus bimaculatus]|nr:Protein of unknown function [Gryllus bimaculatus]